MTPGLLLRGVAPFLSPAHLALANDVVARAGDFMIEDHYANVAVAKLRASGLFALPFPTRDGGFAHDGPVDRPSVRALCLARETLGYRSPLADSIFAVQGLGSLPVVQTAHADRDAILKQVVSGTRVGAFALTEPEAGSDVASMKTTARPTSGGFVLEGTKVFISNAGICDHYVVFARVPGAPKEVIAFLAPASSAGLRVEQVPMSLSHPLGKLTFEGCAIPEAALLGQIGQGMRLALGTLDVFRTSVGAAACGMARRALDETVARVKSRVQFGKPLAEQQLVQAQIAEMATELDAARLLVYRAAAEKDRGESAAIEVAMDKMFSTEAAQRIIDRAVQLFGGVGVTTGNVVEQLLREIRPLRIYEGTTEIQKLIIGGAILK
ncbi:acyl-CoA dehydrogenase family protein [soil metagenome]